MSSMELPFLVEAHLAPYKAQISEDGRNLKTPVISLKFSELSCSLNGPCVEVTLLSQARNVGGSPNKLFISVDRPLDDRVKAFQVGVIRGILNFKVAFSLIYP